MDDGQFKFQMERLESAFGEKFFDIERLDLIRQSVMWMEIGDFASMVSHFISSFKSAPLPKDFKEAVIGFRNSKEKALDLRRPEIFKDSFSNDGLRKALAEKYPGCQNLKEAIAVERHKLQVKRALSGD